MERCFDAVQKTMSKHSKTLLKYQVCRSHKRVRQNPDWNCSLKHKTNVKIRTSKK